MFQELMPLLSQRVLLVTLSRVSDEKICVNVIPKPLKSEPRDDENALTTPLTVTGTPKELDEQLSTRLMEFVGTHLELSSTLKTAKEQIEAAAKAAKEAAKKSTNAKSHSGSSTSTNPRSTQVPAQAEATGDSEASQSDTEPTHAIVAGAGAGLGGSTGSLFDVEPKNGN